MKTRHLLYTLALDGNITTCTNKESIEDILRNNSGTDISVLNIRIPGNFVPICINIQSNCTEIPNEPLVVDKITLQDEVFSTYTPMTLKSGRNNMLGTIIMVPEFESDCQELYIHTNKGVIGPVALAGIHNGNIDSSMQTTGTIPTVHSNIKVHAVTVIIDDNDIVRISNDVLINNTNSLIKYVQWATINRTTTRFEVTLTNDITIDNKLAAAIKKRNDILYINGTADKRVNVKIATTCMQTDILEYIDVNEYVHVKVLDGATVNLTQATRNCQRNGDNRSTLNILIDKDGILNITSSSMNSTDGWNNCNWPGHSDVVIRNNGIVNVKADVSKNAGISLINIEGVFNVEETAQIILSSGTNTLKGIINVAKGSKLNCTNRGLINYGIINNAGELYNVVNSLARHNPINVLPGRIYITHMTALTILKTNRGKVIYNVLPTNAVVVKDGNYIQGIFELTTNANVTTAALTKARITDLTITDGATLSVDNTALTLRHLTVKNANVKGGNPPLADACTFGRLADGILPYTSWNSGEFNSVKLIGNSTITHVKFILGNPVQFNLAQVFLEADGTQADIAFNGRVEFLSGKDTYANVDLCGVTLTAGIDAVVKVGKFVVGSYPKVRSTIRIRSGSRIVVVGTPKHDTQAITVIDSTIR